MSDNQEATTARILDYIEKNRDQIIDFASDLVATPSPNPPGDERAVVSVIQSKFRELGLPEGEIIAAEPHRPNLISRVKGSGNGPTLMFNGHTDTKPVGDQLPLWETDPMKPTIIDGTLYGLGSTDMKGALAAMTYAASALEHLDHERTGDLLLAFVADEEAGAGMGAKYLVDTGAIEADFGLIPEPNGVQSEFQNLPLFCRGTFYFKVKVHGTQTHAGVADQFHTVNASAKMAWVLLRMSQDLELTHERHPYCAEGPTITPGVMVNGGVYFGVHPGYAEFATDCRLIPGMTHEQATADVQAFLDGLVREDPELNVELEVVGGAIQAQLTGDESFVGLLRESAELILGYTPAFGAYPAYTDAYHFHARHGIPCVAGFGPGMLTLAHGPNESISVNGIIDATKMYALAAARYLE
jgi:acetylornithine deacetylase/succinyl-diaminopimelate desuccinylase family protein